MRKAWLSVGGVAVAITSCTASGDTPRVRDGSGAETANKVAVAPKPAVAAKAAPQPVPVQPPSGADRARWRTFAAREWWLAGDEVPCDGRVEDRPIYGAWSKTMGPAKVCYGPDGESVAWWKRGDKACPPGASLTGAPPPIHNAVMCMSASGQPDGDFTFWYEGSGSIEASGVRTDGKLEGVEVRLDESGRLSEVSTFVAGKLHGPAYLYIGGKLAMRSEYVDGVMHGLTTGWYANGALARQSEYVDGQLHGAVNTWGGDGAHCGTQTYEAGTGPIVTYWKNCRVQERGQIVNGVDTGPFEYFDEQGRPTPPPKR